MNRASGIVTAVFGSIAALAGLEHGVGEVLQGSVRPDGIVILSWPDSAFLRILGGEPAMTLVPNLLASGVLTIALSLVLLWWALTIARRPHGGLVMIGLASALLLVGGGFGPPMLGVIVGVAASRARSQHRWVARAPRLHAALSALWPWAVGGGIAAWLMLMPGVPLLAWWLGVESVAIVGIAFVSSMGLLALSIVSGYARDALAGQSGIATV